MNNMANRIPQNQQQPQPGGQQQQQQSIRQNGPSQNGPQQGAGNGAGMQQYIGEKLPMPQPPSNLGPQRDDGSSGYGSPDSETLEIPTAQ